MSKRTRRQSLLRCKKLWETVRDNNFQDKTKAYHLLEWPITSDVDICPACEYNDTHGDKYCNEDCILPWESWNCEATGAEYHVWYCKRTPENANAIVLLCDQAIAKLPPLKKKTKAA